jgi:hypothetical protein
MPLPYENATSGKSAIGEMQKLLKTFGASSFGTMEDFAAGKVIVQFEWRERRVSIEASFKGYAAAWLRHHPHNPRYHRQSKVEYERRALSVGETAVWSILRDWIKGQLTAVEVGMLSFEGAFLGQILLPTGQTVFERITVQKLLALPACN